jgi:predicted nucleic acid-binding protein
MIVLDASVVVEMLLRTSTAPSIEDRLRGSASLHCPELLDVEVAQVLRRYVRSGDLDSARGEEAIADLVDLPIFRHEHRTLLGRVWALRENLTAYDAVYVALAEALDTPLLTRDARLASVAGSLVPVELI